MTTGTGRRWVMVLALAGLALSLIAALTACGSHGKAAAQASALATNPQLAAAEAAWKPVVTTCEQNRHWFTHPGKSAKATVACVIAKVPPAKRKATEKCAIGAFARIPGTGYKAAAEAALFNCLKDVRPVKP
jgi:hypothetical protein